VKATKILAQTGKLCLDHATKHNR